MVERTKEQIAHLRQMDKALKYAYPSSIRKLVWLDNESVSLKIKTVSKAPIGKRIKLVSLLSLPEAKPLKRDIQEKIEEATSKPFVISDLFIQIGKILKEESFNPNYKVMQFNGFTIRRSGNFLSTPGYRPVANPHLKYSILSSLSGFNLKTNFYDYNSSLTDFEQVCQSVKIFTLYKDYYRKDKDAVDQQVLNYVTKYKIGEKVLSDAREALFCWKTMKALSILYQRDTVFYKAVRAICATHRHFCDVSVSSFAKESPGAKSFIGTLPFNAHTHMKVCTALILGIRAIAHNKDDMFHPFSWNHVYQNTEISARTFKKYLVDLCLTANIFLDLYSKSIQHSRNKLKQERNLNKPCDSFEEELLK